MATIEAFDRVTLTYSMTSEGNSEIRFKWITWGLKVKSETAFPAAVEMVTNQGRMKFTRPLYKLMNAWKRDETHKVFEKNRPFMHPTTAKMVAKDIGA